MPELEHVIEEVKRFLKDVETYLSITLKKEKLKRETNTKREELLKDVASIIVKLSPPEIEEEEQEEYADVDVPTSLSADKIQEEREDECDDIYEDTVPESTHSNDSSQNSDDQDDGEEQEDRSGMFDLDGDPYGDVKVDPIAASDLTASSKEGYMDKKRKEGQFGLQAWQKRYCVIKGNILYYYKKKTDKEQCNQIVLTGYQGREAPDFEKKNKRKDLLFEVVCPAKRSYQFIAQNKKDLQEWIKVIAVASKLGPSLVDPLAKSTPNNSGGSEDLSEELYDDTSAPAPSSEANDDDYGDTYEDLDAYQATKIGEQPGATETPAVALFTGDNEEDGEPIEEEIYEDVPNANEPPPAPLPERIPKPSAANKPLPPDPPRSGSPPPVPTTHRPMPAAPDTQTAKPYSPHTQIKSYQGKNVKNIKTGSSPAHAKPAITSTPGPPIPSRSAPEMITALPRKEPWEEDYANIYIGLWDCMADDQDELEFRRGEMVHIISKEYDPFSWWIGEKNNKVGLVPKDYLMKAYMI
ncbi:src kinase-associated phosphoprotein 2-like [Patiria miniata]|uniref:Src kinase-associated phosphoprotein 2 n=1 Tax=Patiria miniata TaxID=46514 RepID=A0A913ZEF0_PATMI|nr:src kinase-associated phosphoprotein 2-like [Patiria miniata]